MTEPRTIAELAAATRSILVEVDRRAPVPNVDGDWPLPQAEGTEQQLLRKAGIHLDQALTALQDAVSTPAPAPAKAA